MNLKEVHFKVENFSRVRVQIDQLRVSNVFISVAHLDSVVKRIFQQYERLKNCCNQVPSITYYLLTSNQLKLCL